MVEVANPAHSLDVEGSAHAGGEPGRAQLGHQSLVAQRRTEPDDQLGCGGRGATTLIDRKRTLGDELLAGAGNLQRLRRTTDHRRLIHLLNQRYHQEFVRAERLQEHMHLLEDGFRRLQANDLTVRIANQVVEPLAQHGLKSVLESFDQTVS